MTPRPTMRPMVEELEPRTVLSTMDLIAVPNAQLLATAGVTPSPSSLTPVQLKQAYDFNGIAFSSGGKEVAADGTGETIAIVDAFNDKTITSDLHAFAAQFSLPNPSLTIVNENGGSTLPKATSTTWAGETALDVEWAHAIAPGANILLVEAGSASLTNLMAAVKTAASTPGVVAVSMSWGVSEFLGEIADDATFQVPGVAFVASSGDSGAGVEFPSSSPNVLAVGGTTLTLGLGGTYQGESAWSGGGGGVSAYELAPAFQSGVTGFNRRSTPDVSYDGSPQSGFAVYDAGNWLQVGGTSAGTPQWAALLALADQGRRLNGLAPLSTAQVEALLYKAPAGDLHDITTGSNGHAAAPGYDLATGLGTPIANRLVPYLANLAPSTVAMTSRPSSNSGLGGSLWSQLDGDVERVSAAFTPTANEMRPAVADVSLSATLTEQVHEPDFSRKLWGYYHPYDPAIAETVICSPNDASCQPDDVHTVTAQDAEG